MIDTLTKRLSLALKLTPEDATVMDIGADMGLLSIALAKRGQKVYASENKKGPFRALTENVKDFEGSNLSCIFTDGIDILPADVDTLILLGMGGKTIFDILSRHEERLNQIRYILMEPQSEMRAPIAFALAHGFENVDGCYVFEKRYYPMLLLKKTDLKKSYSEVEEIFGPYMLHHQDPLLWEFLVKEKERLASLPAVAKSRHETYNHLILEAMKYYEP